MNRFTVLFNFFDSAGNMTTAGYYFDGALSPHGQWVITRQGTDIQIKVPELIAFNPERINIKTAQGVLSARGLI